MNHALASADYPFSSLPPFMQSIFLALIAAFVALFVLGVGCAAVITVRSRAALRRLLDEGPLTGRDLQDGSRLTTGDLKKARKRTSGFLRLEVDAVLHRRRSRDFAARTRADRDQGAVVTPSAFLRQSQG